MAQLTPHFSLEELVASDIAMRRGIDNTPPLDIAIRLQVLARGLEEVRGLLMWPMVISSGYRSKELNMVVGGAPSSAHVQGYAADFTCPSYGNPRAIVDTISRSSLAFDQCIQEGGRWVHISFAPPLRRETLTAYFDATGRVNYLPGNH